MRMTPKTPTHTPTLPCTPYCICNQYYRDCAVDQCDRAIRAVNSHLELVEAVKQAMTALQYWGDIAKSYEEANNPIRLEAHAKLVQALARAEKGE